MKRLIALGISVVLSAELAALSLHDRRFVLWAAGAAALFALVNARQLLGRDSDPPQPEELQLDPPDEDARRPRRRRIDTKRQHLVDRRRRHDVDQPRAFLEPGIAPRLHHRLRLLWSDSRHG